MQLNGEIVIPKFGTYYTDTNKIALQLMDEYDNPYAVITKNLSGEILSNKNCAHIDINNNGIKILDWLEKNGFGKITGEQAQSGFCVYPEFEFDSIMIEKYSA